MQRRRDYDTFGLKVEDLLPPSIAIPTSKIWSMLSLLPLQKLFIGKHNGEWQDRMLFKVNQLDKEEHFLLMKTENTESSHDIEY